MTLRFETKNGTLYDFKGINHNIIFAIFYYEPIQKNIPTSSILNPEYKMNYLDYLYKQEEIEGDSDDEENEENEENIAEDFSRDNIEDYKIKEQQYNENGVKLQQFNNYYQNNNQSVIMENEDDNDDEEDDEDDNDEEENINYNQYFINEDNK